MPTLTKRQKQIYEFIKGYIKKNGISPTFEEIKKHLKLRALSTIHEHVEELIEKGFVTKTGYGARSIELAKSISGLVEIPLLGTIAAGQPIEVITEKETIAVPKKMLPRNGNFYALRVSGNSMVDENVNYGDVVLIKEQSTAENGQKIVALIDNNEATLKKFYKEKNHISLQPANKKMEPIIIKENRELAIQGVLIDVIKNEENLQSKEIIPTEETSKFNKLPLNKIICGDAIKELQKIPDKTIDLIITDPPYGISRELNCKGQRLGTTAKLNFNFGEWDKLNNDWFDIALKKTRGWMMTFCAKKDIGFFINSLEKNGFIAVDVLVWQKPDPIPLNAKSRFLNAWEAIVIGKKPGAIWNSTYEHNIIKFQAPKGKNRFHPTQKPVELIKKLINLTTNAGDIVLDPFMGSGTTAVACIEANRNYIGFEISKEYWEQSMNRIKHLPKRLI